MAKTSSAVSTALKYLQKQIDANIWKQGDRLPTVAQIAHSAGVSITTVIKAMHILQKKDLVTVHRKSGIFLGSSKDRKKFVVEDSEVKLLRWESVKNLIAKDIIEGKYEHGRLPSYKELAYLYGTGYGTLKKALQTMVGNKTITPDKRSYRINNQNRVKPHSSIILIQGDAFIDQLSVSYFQNWFYVFRFILEKECGQRNIQVMQHIYTGFSESVKTFSGASGFIIWLDQSLEKHINNILIMLEEFKKPITIFMVGNVFITQKIIKNQYTYFFGVGDATAGYTVGKFLLESGHRHICYLARTHEYWADTRLQGIKNAFRAQGFDESTLTSLFFSDYNTTRSLDKMLNSKDNKHRNVLQIEEQKIRTTIDGLNSLFIDSDVKSYVTGKMYESTYVTWYRHAFTALFRKALTIPHVTAWVIGDDYLATYGALEFCKRNYIKIPQQLSIISFNNMIEAFTNKLTSYDFNIPALTHKMLHVILDAPRKNARKENAIQEVDGFIAVRDSTGRV